MIYDFIEYKNDRQKAKPSVFKPLNLPNSRQTASHNLLNIYSAPN